MYDYEKGPDLWVSEPRQGRDPFLISTRPELLNSLPLIEDQSVVLILVEHMLFPGSIINCNFRGGESCGSVQLSSSSSVSADWTFKVGKSSHVSSNQAAHRQGLLFWCCPFIPDL